MKMTDRGLLELLVDKVGTSQEAVPRHLVDTSKSSVGGGSMSRKD